MGSKPSNLADGNQDTVALRKVLGNFATGVTVVTTLGDEGAPVGLAVNSFASVSLDPPLVIWSIALKSPSLDAFRRHSAFAINIMCDESKDVVLNFARPSPDKFSGVEWEAGYEGVPVLVRAAAVLQCHVDARLPGGDHEIYLGRVVDCHATDKSPLVFYKGNFASLGDAI